MRTTRQRARRFAGFYMGEDPEAPNYDPAHKIIRSMENGSRGPMLRKATPLDWVGDPFDVKGFDALHGESTFEQFLAHYQEYGDVVGDHFLNLVATTLPMNAYLLAGEPKYKKWIVDYMDAWLDRMKQNGGIIPSFVDLDGRIGGPEGKWWKNAYGWGFSPVNPVTGKREDRNRIPRALVGFNNALLVTGDQKYVDAWRTMIDAVNSHARDDRRHASSIRRCTAPRAGMAGGTTRGTWARWRSGTGRRGRGTSSAAGRRRLAGIPRKGRIPRIPEEALRARSARRSRSGSRALRRDTTPPEKRLADNMLDFNPAATDSLVQLMWGALVPGREGGLLNARLRYFDPDQEARRRARGRGGARLGAVRYASHGDARQPESIPAPDRHRAGRRLRRASAHSVTGDGDTTAIGGPLLTVQLDPGSGQKLVLEMKRYANTPTILHPWQRPAVARGL